MILSLLYRMTPEECRMIMIDPKMLELSIYDDIPHLLSPVVTEPGKAIRALKWTVEQFGALAFETALVPPPISLHQTSRLLSRHRPWVIDFVGPARDARIILSWKGWANEVNRFAVNVEPKI